MSEHVDGTAATGAPSDPGVLAATSPFSTLPAPLADDSRSDDSTAAGRPSGLPDRHEDAGGSRRRLMARVAARHRAALATLRQLRRGCSGTGAAPAGVRSVTVWADQIARSVMSSLRRNTPLTVAAVLCMAISLCMVGTSLLVASGVDAATERWRGGVETIVFLDPGVSDTRAAQVRATLEQNPDVGELEYVTQAEAYAEFSEMFANSPELVASVRAEALPSSLRITPVDGTPPERVAQLAEGLRTAAGGWQDGVYQVVYAKDAVDSVMSVSAFARNGLLGVAAVLALCALVLTFAACRAAAWARRDELAVMRLVGAPRWLVRAPFVAEGAISGLIGAVFASGGIALVVRWVERRVDSGGTVALLQYFDVGSGQVRSTMLQLLALGALLGTLGAALAVRRHVSDDDAAVSLRSRAGRAAAALRDVVGLAASFAARTRRTGS